MATRRPEEPSSIANHVHQCLISFQDACINLAQADAAVKRKLSPGAITDQLGRFRLWCGNIAAHRRGKSSLDHKLREASHIRDRVIELLLNLLAVIKEAVEIITGQRVPWEDLSDSDSDISEAESAHDEESETELQQLAANMAEINTCLMRLSMAIRNPAPHDQFKESKNIKTSHFETFDIDHVRGKFPQAEDFLIDRLGRAISRRRQYLRYRKEHRDKFEQGLQSQKLLQPEEAPSVLETAPHPPATVSAAPTPSDQFLSTVASSLPLAIKTMESSTDFDENDYYDDTMSQTSYASSTNDPSRLRPPPIPEEGQDGDPFECTLCYRFTAVKTQAAWHKHIYGDLQPYVCTFKDCELPDRIFESRQEWFNHELQAHRKFWQCIDGCDIAFYSLSVFRSHVEGHHMELSTSAHLDDLTRSCERQRSMEAEADCPLCRQHLSSLVQLRRHLGRHCEELALFALPSYMKDDDTDDSEAELDSQFNVESEAGLDIDAKSSSESEEEWETDEAGNFRLDEDGSRVPRPGKHKSYYTVTVLLVRWQTQPQSVSINSIRDMEIAWLKNEFCWRYRYEFVEVPLPESLEAPQVLQAAITANTHDSPDNLLVVMYFGHLSSNLPMHRVGLVPWPTADHQKFIVYWDYFEKVLKSLIVADVLVIIGCPYINKPPTDIPISPGDVAAGRPNRYFELLITLLQPVQESSSPAAPLIQALVKLLDVHGSSGFTTANLVDMLNQDGDVYDTKLLGRIPRTQGYHIRLTPFESLPLQPEELLVNADYEGIRGTLSEVSQSDSTRSEQPKHFMASPYEVLRHQLPLQDVIELEFDDLMVRKGLKDLPEPTGQEMAAYDTGRKWSLVCQYALHESQRKGDESPEWYARKLISDEYGVINFDALLQLLKYRPGGWAWEFIRAGGRVSLSYRMAQVNKRISAELSPLGRMSGSKSNGIEKTIIQDCIDALESTRLALLSDDRICSFPRMKGQGMLSQILPHDPRPPDGVVELAFRELMMERAWNTPQMEAWQIEKKWALICHHRLDQEKKRQKQNRVDLDALLEELEQDESSPRWYIGKLKNNSISLQELSNLYVSLRAAPISWIETFLEAKGQFVLAGHLARVFRIQAPSTEPGQEYPELQTIRMCLDSVALLGSRSGHSRSHKAFWQSIVPSRDDHAMVRKALMDNRNSMFYASGSNEGLHDTNNWEFSRYEVDRALSTFVDMPFTTPSLIQAFLILGANISKANSESQVDAATRTSQNLPTAGSNDAQSSKVQLSSAASRLGNMLGLHGMCCGVRLEYVNNLCNLPIPDRTQPRVALQLELMVSLTQESRHLETELQTLARLAQCQHHQTKAQVQSRIESWKTLFPAGNDEPVALGATQIEQVSTKAPPTVFEHVKFLREGDIASYRGTLFILDDQARFEPSGLSWHYRLPYSEITVIQLNKNLLLGLSWSGTIYEVGEAGSVLVGQHADLSDFEEENLPVALELIKEKHSKIKAGPVPMESRAELASPVAPSTEKEDGNQDDPTPTQNLIDEGLADQHVQRLKNKSITVRQLHHLVGKVDMGSPSWMKAFFRPDVLSEVTSWLRQLTSPTNTDTFGLDEEDFVLMTGGLRMCVDLFANNGYEVEEQEGEDSSSPDSDMSISDPRLANQRLVSIFGEGEQLVSRRNSESSDTGEPKIGDTADSAHQMHGSSTGESSAKPIEILLPAGAEIPTDWLAPETWENMKTMLHEFVEGNFNSEDDITREKYEVYDVFNENNEIVQQAEWANKVRLGRQVYVRKRAVDTHPPQTTDFSEKTIVIHKVMFSPFGREGTISLLEDRILFSGNLTEGYEILYTDISDLESENQVGYSGALRFTATVYEASRDRSPLLERNVQCTLLFLHSGYSTAYEYIQKSLSVQKDASADGTSPEKSMRDLEEQLQAPSTDTVSQSQTLPAPASALTPGEDGTDRLDAEIEIQRKAVLTFPEHHPRQGECLLVLSSLLGDRFTKREDMLDLEEALEYARAAVEATPNDHPDRAACLENLSLQYSRRYVRLEELDDLEESIQAARDALEITPAESPNKSHILYNLSNQLANRSSKIGSGADLDEAIRFAREAIIATPKEHAQVQNLSIQLGKRYAKLGQMTDLHEDIYYAREALSLMSEDHPDRGGSLEYLARQLGIKHSRTNAISDLDEAIQLAREAVTHFPNSSMYQAARLGMLGYLLLSKYTATKTEALLEEAIRFTQEAIEVASTFGSNSSSWCASLSIQLGERYRKLRLADDLDMAVHWAELAVVNCPHSDPKRAAWLGNLGLRLFSRYQVGKSLSDLEKAVEAERECIAATPESDPERATRLNTLSNRLATQFSRTKKVADLDESIRLGKECIAVTAEDHPRRAAWLRNLEQRIRDRSLVTIGAQVEESETGNDTQSDVPNEQSHVESEGSLLIEKTALQPPSREIDHESLPPLSQVDPSSEGTSDVQEKIAQKADMISNDLRDRLRTFPPFDSDGESFLIDITKHLNSQLYESGETIIREGEAAEAIYWLVRGTLQVTSEDKREMYTELTPGVLFGELSLLVGVPRLASVLATKRSLVVCLSKQDLLRELPKYPKARSIIMNVAKEHLAILERVSKYPEALRRFLSLAKERLVHLYRRDQRKEESGEGARTPIDSQSTLSETQTSIHGSSNVTEYSKEEKDPETSTTSPRPKNKTLYVGGLSLSVTEDHLRQIFKSTGPIQSVKIIRQSIGLNYGFVEFDNPEQAAVAMQTMNGQRIFDNEIRLNWAYGFNSNTEDSSKPSYIFVGDLSNAVNDEVLYREFSTIGSISEARVMWDMKTGRSRGYGFVGFRERSDAERAIWMMDGEWIGGRAIRCAWAAQSQEPSVPQDQEEKLDEVKSAVPGPQDVINRSQDVLTRSESDVISSNASSTPTKSKRLPPLAPGPTLQFHVASHPDDFKAAIVTSTIPSRPSGPSSHASLTGGPAKKNLVSDRYHTPMLSDLSPETKRELDRQGVDDGEKENSDDEEVTAIEEVTEATSRTPDQTTITDRAHHGTETGKDEVPKEFQIFVDNLPDEVDGEALLESFAAFGTILHIFVGQYSTPSKSQRYGIVDFHERSDAERALTLMNGTMMGSHIIHCDWAIHDSVVPNQGPIEEKLGAVEKAVQGFPGWSAPQAQTENTTTSSSEDTRSYSWSEEDDKVLLQNHAQGLGWNQISPLFVPFKSPNACRKRYEQLMEKQTVNQQVDEIRKKLGHGNWDKAAGENGENSSLISFLTSSIATNFKLGDVYVLLRNNIHPSYLVKANKDGKRGYFLVSADGLWCYLLQWSLEETIQLLQGRNAGWFEERRSLAVNARAPVYDGKKPAEGDLGQPIVLSGSAVNFDPSESRNTTTTTTDVAHPSAAEASKPSTIRVLITTKVAAIPVELALDASGAVFYETMSRTLRRASFTIGHDTHVIGFTPIRGSFENCCYVSLRESELEEEWGFAVGWINKCRAEGHDKMFAVVESIDEEGVARSLSTIQPSTIYQIAAPPVTDLNTEFEFKVVLCSGNSSMNFKLNLGASGTAFYESLRRAVTQRLHRDLDRDADHVRFTPIEEPLEKCYVSLAEDQIDVDWENAVEWINYVRSVGFRKVFAYVEQKGD